MIAVCFAPQLTGSPDSSLIRRRRERSGERMRRQRRMEEEEESKRSGRQRSGWNVRGDERVKEVEEEGVAENKCNSNLLLSCSMLGFYLLRVGKKKNISDHQSKF